MLVFRSGCVPGGEPAKLRAKLRAPSSRNHPAVNRSHLGRERGMTIAKLAIVGLYSKWLNKCALQAMKHRPAGLALSRACRELSKSRHLPKGSRLFGQKRREVAQDCVSKFCVRLSGSRPVK